MPAWLKELQELTSSDVFIPVRIAFLIVVAFVVRLVVHRVINRTVRQALAREPQPHHLRAAQALAAATTLPHERRAGRIRALSSLARSLSTAVILAVLVIQIFAELGFNVTTVVASTTVIGLTVGFGMQTIIKDLISGVLMLVDDQLGVGDYVEMAESSGGASGTVEAVGFRVTQLRDDDGTVWYVRNGEVLRVGNYSQGGQGRPPVRRELKPINVRPPGRRLLRFR